MTTRTLFHRTLGAVGFLAGLLPMLPAAAPAVSIPVDPDQGHAARETLKAISQPDLGFRVGSTTRMTRTERTAQYLARAAQARSFQNPGAIDSLLGESKRVEVLNLIWAALHGDTTQRGRMNELVAIVRRDPVLPEIRRFEVVAWAQQADLTAQRGAGGTARMRALEANARALVAEFPRVREGYESLVAVARDTTPEDATRIVGDLVTLRAPADVQQEAAGILALQTLVGRPFKEIMGATAGTESWSALEGSVRIVYCWDGSALGSLAPFLKKLAARHPQVRWIGVCIDPNVEQARSLALGAALVGTLHYGGTGPNAAADALSFHLSGQAVLVDRAGIIRSANALTDINRKMGGLGS